MTRFKLLFPFLSITLVLLCCSCGFFGDREYVCDIEEVESIEIVRIEELAREEQARYTVLASITDYSDFVERLNSIDYTINWGDPRVLKEDFVVIKIQYLNGDRETIHWSAQSFDHSDGKKTGYFTFNEEQFNTLVSDYLKSNCTLVVNGKDISDDAYVYLHSEEQYAELPLVAILEELGASFEWKYSKSANVSYNGKTYNLYIEENSLTELDENDNFIAFPPDATHPACHSIAGEDYLVDSSSALAFWEEAGVTMTIDYENSTIYIDNH